jgi:hypothetical protein
MTRREHLAELEALFSRDHDRMRTTLSDVEYLCRKQSFPTAAKRFGELRLIIEQHLTAEERALDTLDREGHLPHGLAERIGEAHQALREKLRSAWDSLTQHDGQASVRAIHELTAALAAHERGEREELLPALTASFPDPLQLDRAVSQLIQR